MSKPALRAEEWRDGCVTLDDDDGRMYTQIYRDGDTVGHTFDGEYEPFSNPHGVAALCLHEQPFGFTRQDVEDERQAYHDAVMLARHYQEAGMEEQRQACIARAARHMGRADRIEALLQPEP